MAATATAPLLATGGRAQEEDGRSRGSDGTRRVEIVSSGSKQITYELTANGAIAPVEGSTEGNDSVTENGDGTWTATGTVLGRGRDLFTVEGRITSLTPTKGSFTVRVDGIEFDPATVAKKKTLQSLPTTEKLFSGGDGYPNTVPRSAADAVVATADDLERALNDADRGDVVYVAGDATIDVGAQELTIPSGVTLASNRGIDGASGGLVTAGKVDWEGLFSVQDDVRVTGVRISGPLDEFVQYTKPIHSGLLVEGSGVEIDNVEIFGFNHAAIKLNASAYVHHSHIHGNSMEGLGYGISCNGGQNTLVEYNRFNFNRHCVANNGSAGYEVRYNRFDGKQIEYQVGTHRPGGTTLKIHHNTFVTTNHLDGGDPDSHISIRGVPDDVADIHHNWFHNPQQPSAGRGTESVIQPHVSSLSSVDLTDNHYGADEPAPDIGCPR